MKNSLRFFLGMCLLVLIACWSCGENSEAERKQAEQAMENAKSVFAEELAPTNWVDAMKSWEQGQAALKQGKPAKAHFVRAKARFEKTAAIARAESDIIAKEVSSLQVSIGERIAKVRSALDRGRIPPKVKKQVMPLAAEVEEGILTIEALVGEKNFLKARTLAKDLQSKIYNAELMVAGRKKVS